LADDVVLIVDKEIDAEVAELREGRGKTVKDGALASTFERVDQTKHAWFVLRVADWLESEMRGSPFQDPKQMWGTAHFGSELQLAFGTQLADAAAATTMRDTAQRGFDEMKGMLPAMGLPATLVSKVTIGATDDRFTVEASATTTELESLRDAIKKLM
jgi:hypothetical protein